MAFQKIGIETLKLAQANLPSIKIDKIAPGKTIIKQLQLQGIELGIKKAKLTLSGITIDVKLALFLDYEISDLTGLIKEKGTAAALGELRFSANLGNKAINLPSIACAIDQMAIDNLGVDVAPICNLLLPSMVAKTIKMTNLKMPTLGFNLSNGISLKGMELSDFALSDAAADSVNVGNVCGMNVTVPKIDLPNISIDFDVDNINMDRVKTDLNLGKYSTGKIQILSCPPTPVNFSVTLSAQPTVTLTINRLIVSNMKQNLSLKKTVATNLELPFDIIGIQLSNLKIIGIDIPKISMG